ncbi:MAG: hypothetical protein U0105_12195 [Candidatus Obscuribacterales bacterium]|jgi:hypothetical protein
MTLNHWNKGSGLKAGQNVVCRIEAATVGGYAVKTTSNQPGYLVTPMKFREGEEVLAQFVSVQGNRMVLSPLLGDQQVSKPRR